MSQNHTPDWSLSETHQTNGLLPHQKCEVHVSTNGAAAFDEFAIVYTNYCMNFWGHACLGKKVIQGSVGWNRYNIPCHSYIYDFNIQI